MLHSLPIVDVNPRDADFYQNPYSYYAQWHKQHARFHWAAYGKTCFASFADVDRILRDRRFGRALPDDLKACACPMRREHLASFDALEEYSLLNLEPPRHSALRKLVNRAFVSSKVDYLRPQIIDVANALIDQLLSSCGGDLLQDYLMPLPAMVIARLLGVPDEQVPQLLAWSHAMVKVYTLTQTHEDELAADVASKEFNDYLLKLITQKRKSPSDDLLGHLLSVEVDARKLSDAEIISTAVLLLNAGHEATVHQSGNAVKTVLELGLAPDQLFSSDSTTADFVEEMLRFDAPLHMFMRYALQEVDMGDGLILQPGEEVALLFGAANRDPKRFVDPDSCLPGRADAGHVSFGAGIHFCLGAPLARLEMQLSLPLLFERMPRLSLRENPLYADSFHFHGLQSLFVNFNE